MVEIGGEGMGRIVVVGLIDKLAFEQNLKEGKSWKGYTLYQSSGNLGRTSQV